MGPMNSAWIVLLHYMNNAATVVNSKFCLAERREWKKKKKKEEEKENVEMKTQKQTPNPNPHLISLIYYDYPITKISY